MKYDLRISPLSDDDKPLKDDQGNEVNFRKMLMNVASSGVDKEGNPVKGDKKMEFYSIYTRLKTSKDAINLSAEEVGLLSGSALAFPIIVAGQIRDFLDNPINKED